MKASGSPDRWERMMRLLDEVIDLSPEERAIRLDESCKEDTDMRREMDALLADEEAAAAYFQDLRRSILFELPPSSEVPPDPYHLIGTVVSHFEIRDLLGGGGMGVVYRAFDTQLKRFVALKFLPLHWSRDPIAKQRFIAEAQAASALEHPNVCTIYEIGVNEEGYLFIAMAYYNGESLKQKIARGALPVVKAIEYARQIAQGLSKAHGHGIIHRDIKPANVMVTSDEVVKIVDFGLAKMVDMHLTRSGVTLGTVSYMSPEQARAEAIDERSDIWSLGVMLYEMLAGERPFKGNHEQAVLHAILDEEHVPLRRLQPDLSPDVERVVQHCLEKKKHRRYASVAALQADLESILYQMKAGGISLQQEGAKERRQARQLQIFLSYERNAHPDQALISELYKAFSPTHHVFIDQTIAVGTHWVEQIESAIRGSDFFVVLLSEHSAYSEMTLAELDMAHRCASTQGGRPVILPVRVAYRGSFGYPQNLYLDGIQCAYWENEQDTPRLVQQLSEAMRRGRLERAEPFPSPDEPPGQDDQMPVPLVGARPLPHLELPAGTMDPHSVFYVERPEDRVAIWAIKQQGVTITIKGPRQIGKSSLLTRTMEAAARAGKRVAYLDFQLFGETALKDADTFFRQFCAWLADELDVEDHVEEIWRRPLGNSQRCTRYVERYLLKQLDVPLLLAMDEVERVFDTAYRSDFFSMLRSWHNDRAFKPLWRQLDLALVTSTEPYQLIENLNQSPFNVGEIIELTDFTLEQVAELNRRHGLPLSVPEVRQLEALLNGHPYLTRKALYLLTSRRIAMSDLLAHATEDTGPFSDHLRYHLFRLYGHDELIQGLRQVLHHRACSDENTYWRLHGAGLVRRDGLHVLPRCKLYQDFLSERLDV